MDEKSYAAIIFRVLQFIEHRRKFNTDCFLNQRLERTAVKPVKNRGYSIKDKIALTFRIELIELVHMYF